jgi:sec-independent protein translocase protein TatA
MPEILIVLLIVLLVFGAKRLPEIGASMGKGIREFKRSFSEVKDNIESADNEGATGRRLDAPPAADREPKKLSQ